MSAKRVYICHTYYHAYQAVVKELVQEAKTPQADILLSAMSNDFETLDVRLRESGIFCGVYRFEEKEDVTDETVMKYHRDRGNLVANLWQRIRYTKLLGQLQAPYVPVDLAAYEDVYVFCDSDPIGYYLNEKKIPYHAIEDGLNSGKLDDQARLSNQGAFGLKKLLAKTGLIFIPCGYSRYCIDYEVNDISVNLNPPRNIVECPVEALYKKLTKEDHALLVTIFLPEAETVLRQIKEAGDKPCAMLLTEPLCDMEVRERLFRDIIAEYEETYTVLIKPHPRDALDYEVKFPKTVVLRGRFPMEVLGDVEELRIDKLISVITQVDHLHFAKEIVYLGLDFLDRYEEPAIHRKTELLRK